MAFNLKKVLKALLLSTNQPLAIKDIRAAFSRFHDTSLLPAEEAPAESAEPGAAADAAGGPAGTPSVDPAVEAVEVVAEAPADPELYADVPSLITGTHIREAMDEIAAELRA